MNWVFILLAGLLLFADAKAKDPSNALNILVFERYPYVFIADGKLSGLVGEPARQALDSAALPYKLLSAPASRVLNAIRDAAGASCAVGWFKTEERERFAYFSRPLFQSQPFLVLTSRKNTRLTHSLKVEDLLADRNLTMLVVQSFSYGRAFDLLISQFNPNSRTVTADNMQILQMLLAGRVDYSLMAPEELEGLLALPGFKRDDFRALPLINPPAGEARYFMCSKQVSPELLERINDHIPNLAVSDSSVTPANSR